MMAAPSLLSVVTVFVSLCMNDVRAAVVYDQIRSAPPLTVSSPGSELTVCVCACGYMLCICVCSYLLPVQHMAQCEMFQFMNK